MRVGIIGAGVAGLSCARRLAEHGIAASLFDKGNRPGGRLSTRAGDGRAWDFGAPCFTARDQQFQAAVARWQSTGVVAPWPNGPAGAWVGTPGMSVLVEALGANLDVTHGALVHGLAHDGLGWSVQGAGMPGERFDAMVVAIPAEQAAPLLSLHDLLMAREAVSVRSSPCWTVLAAFAERLSLPDWIETRGTIFRAARNGSKPGRGPDECWVIQANPEWSRDHLEAEREEIAASLLQELAALAGTALPVPLVARAHRWRFALPLGGRGGPLWNPLLRLGACGDWTLDGSVEGAWLSGTGLADQVAADLLSDSQSAAAE